MGLFDDLGKTLGGALGQGAASGGQGALIQALLAMLAGGGLQGLVRSFQEKGLGDVVASWISTGQNLPISADQITKVLGQDRIGQLAQQTGLEGGRIAGQIAEVLPGIVDKLSPGGALPDGDALQKGLGALKGLFS